MTSDIEEEIPHGIRSAVYQNDLFRLRKRAVKTEADRQRDIFVECSLLVGGKSDLEIGKGDRFQLRYRNLQRSAGNQNDRRFKVRFGRQSETGYLAVI